MQPYPLAMQLGMKRFYGHIFLAPGKLYYVCGKQGGAWLSAIGMGVGGLAGHAVASLADKKIGAAPDDVDEPTAIAAVANNDGSLTMEAAKIELIRSDLWWRLIKYDGKKFGFFKGLDKPLKLALGEWARAHDVKTKGL